MQDSDNLFYDTLSCERIGYIALGVSGLMQGIYGYYLMDTDELNGAVVASAGVVAISMLMRLWYDSDSYGSIGFSCDRDNFWYKSWGMMLIGFVIACALGGMAIAQIVDFDDRRMTYTQIALGAAILVGVLIAWVTPAVCCTKDN